MRNRRAGNSSATRLLWVVGSVVSVLFIVAVSYAYYGDRGAAHQALGTQATSGQLAVAGNATHVAETDTDGDGVPDWEESLWGTDPNKADTDGDGTPDTRGSSTATNWRDVSATVLASTTETTGGNVTTVATQELLGTYMSRVAQQNSATLSPEEQAQLVEDAIRKSATNFAPPTLSATDLTVVPSSPAAGKKYSIAMTVILSDLLSGAAHDYELMRDLTTEQKTDAVSGLKRSVDHYGQIIERMRSVTVPQDALINHADMVTALMGYSYMIESIGNMDRDPVKAAAALQLVVQYDQSLTNAITLLGRYMSAYTS